MIKVDQALEEVWEMKARVYEDFLKSGFESIVDYINEDTREFKIKYDIKNRIDKKEIEKQPLTIEC